MLDGHLPDVEADVPALHRAHVEHARLHLERADSLEHHVIVAIGIPDGRGGQGEEREGIAQRRLQPPEVAAQEPVVHAELLAPRGHRVRLVHHHQADVAVAREVADVIRQQQLGREVEQVNLPLAYPAIHLRLLLGREVGRGIAHAVVAHVLQALHLVHDEGLQRRHDQGQHPVPAAQVDGRQLEQQGLARPGGRRQQDVVHVRLAFAGLLRLAQDVFYQLALGNADGILPPEEVVVDLQLAEARITIYFLQQSLCLGAAGIGQAPFLQLGQRPCRDSVVE